jgi:hypothetical protein
MSNYFIMNFNYSYIKYLKTFMDDDVMIFGCDVNKPSPADKNYRGASEEMTESVAAVIKFNNIINFKWKNTF